LIVYLQWCATRPLLFPWRCPAGSYAPESGSEGRLAGA